MPKFIGKGEEQNVEHDEFVELEEELDGEDSEATSEEYHDDPIIVEKREHSRLVRGFGAFVILIVSASYYLSTSIGGRITLNSGANPIIFGQGSMATPTCTEGESLEVSGFSTPSQDSSGFKLSSIVVKNVPETCNYKDLIISVYDDSSSTPLAIFNGSSTAVVVYSNAGTFQPLVGSTGYTVTSEQGKFSINFTNPVANSTAIEKLSIQSTEHTFACSEGGDCVVGDTGPGGGVVFYASASSFACGPTLSGLCKYLESAPTNGASKWTDIPVTGWASTAANYVVFGTGTAIGTGSRNTSLVLERGNSGAVGAASSFRGPNNLTDWYLPSRDELDLVYTSRVIIGGIISNTYFSSSEFGSTKFWFKSMSNGTSKNTGSKTSTSYVRPIRAF